MPLQYIIDGYNIINHPGFSQQIHKKSRDPKTALLGFIQISRPCGKPRGNITVVFDGYPDSEYRSPDIKVVFSREITADEYIKRFLEKSNNCRQIIVVSDDKEIRFFAQYCQAQPFGVEDFISAKKKAPNLIEDLKPELSYAQIHQINQELKKRWLK